MLYRLYVIFAKHQLKYYYTARPEVDIYFWQQKKADILWLSNPLPFGKLLPQANLLKEKQASKQSIFSKIAQVIGVSVGPSISDAEVKQQLKLKAETVFGKVNEPVQAVVYFPPHKVILQQLFQILAGRILFIEEIHWALREQKRGFPQDLDIEAALQYLYLLGKLKVLPGVTSNNKLYKCNRCGEIRRILPAPCAACGDAECFYCDNCVGMGQARTCNTLYAVVGEKRKTISVVKPVLDFPLTVPQKAAFKAISDFTLGEKQVGLVWAACGAGKTEVSFGAIQATLNAGGRVLYAIPRKDVVLELEPRVRKAFPNVQVTVLYGGSPSKYEIADIVLATTHQCLRFYRNFDLVVLDEADAFPYEGSSMLYLAVERARSEKGKIIYMSATPTEQMLQWVEEGRATKVMIPARHHGFPLPLPQYYLDPKLTYPGHEGKIILPKAIKAFIEQCIIMEKGQLFVFVPTVSVVESVSKYLKELFIDSPDFRIDFSYARHKERDVKRMAFAKGKINILVTTSIMERGITVAGAHVLVLYADFDKIFSWRALLQMAGRAGRKKEQPKGNIMFAAASKTAAMDEAKKVIQHMNKVAKNKGYLK